MIALQSISDAEEVTNCCVLRMFGVNNLFENLDQNILFISQKREPKNTRSQETQAKYANLDSQ